MSGPIVAWQRRSGAPSHVWMRVDGVLVVGEDLIDIRSGAVFSEPPWEFLGLLRPRLVSDPAEPLR